MSRETDADGEDTDGDMNASNTVDGGVAREMLLALNPFVLSVAHQGAATPVAQVPVCSSSSLKVLRGSSIVSLLLLPSATTSW